MGKGCLIHWQIGYADGRAPDISQRATVSRFCTVSDDPNYVVDKSSFWVTVQE